MGHGNARETDAELQIPCVLNCSSALPCRVLPWWQSDVIGDRRCDCQNCRLWCQLSALQGKNTGAGRWRLSGHLGTCGQETIGKNAVNF